MLFSIVGQLLTDDLVCLIYQSVFSFNLKFILQIAVLLQTKYHTKVYRGSLFYHPTIVVSPWSYSVGMSIWCQSNVFVLIAVLKCISYLLTTGTLLRHKEGSEMALG